MNSREEVPEEERQIEAALEVANKYERTPAMIIIIIITLSSSIPHGFPLILSLSHEDDEH